MEKTNDKFDYRRFMTVTDALELRIRQGQITSGLPFLNRAEICERFGISLVTAHKVQRELVNRGLIASRNGRTFIVCDPNRFGTIPLRTVRLIRQVPGNGADRVMDAIADGARKTCQEHDLEFQEEYVELLDKNSRKISIAGDCTAGQAVILHPYREMMLRAASYFIKYWFQRVTIDNPLPDTPGVLVDSIDGLELLLEQAKKDGVQRMLLVPSASTWQNLYISERLHLAEHMAPRYGIELQTLRTTSYESIAAKIQSDSPDAILLLYDDDIDQLQYFLSEKNVKIPHFYIFARNMLPRPGCTCYETDYRELGSAAVEELLAYPTTEKHTFLRYIRGKLVLP